MADETFDIDIDADAKGALRAFKKVEAAQKKLELQNKKLNRLRMRSDEKLNRIKIRSEDKFDRAINKASIKRQRLSQQRVKSESRAAEQRVKSESRAAEKINRSVIRSVNEGTRRRNKIEKDNFRALTKSAKDADRKQTAFDRKRSASVASARAGMLGLAADVAKVGVAVAVLSAGFTIGVTKKFSEGVIAAKEFNITSKLAFTSLTGDAQKGAQAFALVNKTADRLSLGIEDTANQMKSLLAAQFTIQEANEFISLAADLRAVGATAEEANSAIRAITQIKAKGQFFQEEQQQLSEAKLSKELVDKALISQLGIAGKAELRKLQEAGKITGDQALKAIREAILTKTHGEEAGDAAAKFAAVSINAMSVRISNSMFRLFQDVAESAPDAFKKLGGVGKGLDEFIQGLNRETLADIFDTAILGLETLVTLGKEFTTGFIEGLGGETDSLDAFFKDLVRPENLQAFKEFGVSFAQFSASVIKLGAALADLPNVIGAVKDSFSFLTAGTPLGFLNIAEQFNADKQRNEMVVAGGSVMDGLMSGIRSRFPLLSSLMTAVGIETTRATESELGISSPSKVFEGIGENVVAGFNQGIQAPSMAAASSGAGASASAQGGSTNNFNMGGVNMSNTVNGAKDPAASVAAMTSQVEQVMGRVFENMALQSGVA